MFNLLNCICYCIDDIIVDPIKESFKKQSDEFKQKHLIVPTIIILIFIVVLYCALNGIL